MKALSLWQPWASAVVRGSKLIETRSWLTNYRGTLLIHAGLATKYGDLEQMAWPSVWEGALIGRPTPLGCLIGTVDVVDCRPIESFSKAELDGLRGDPGRQWTERHMGDYRPGRFGWILENPVEFEVSIPWKGRQMLFNVPDEVVQGLVPLNEPPLRNRSKQN